MDPADLPDLGQARDIAGQMSSQGGRRGKTSESDGRSERTRRFDVHERARRVGETMFAVDTASKDTMGMELLSCEPATELPMAQRYFLF